MPVRMYDIVDEKDRIVYGFVDCGHEICAVVYEKVFNDKFEMITVPAKHLRPIE